MPLSGIEIYKLLPKSNCKECKFPTCLAFAMKLAQKQAELSACPYVSEEAKQALDAAARPPIRLVTVGANPKSFQVGNEVVLFRHEKTFYHPTALVVRVSDSDSADSIANRVKEATTYTVERVGHNMGLQGIAIQNKSGDKAAFARCAQQVQSLTDLPLMLMASDPGTMEAALEKAAAQKPLLYAATRDNWQPMAALAKKYQCPVAICEPGGLQPLSDLTEQVSKTGVEDIVLDPGVRDFNGSLVSLTQIRRLALKSNFRPLGYPVITFPSEAASSLEEEALLAGQQIAKYASIVVLDHFSPEMVYPLLTLRMNIYTDPQKPIQVTPGVYPFGNPKPTSPLLVTTNFSLTYFSVAGEVESSGFPSWLMVTDTEGLSVLTSWAAGKFDAPKIAKTVKEFKISEMVSHQSLILPGAVAVLRGELEEELSGWKVMVGPRDAVDIGSYLKRSWTS
ncbi:MAG: acetyl-CoA decarbonylase/synthase complex subunit gamma [Chloroflexi bacterium]|nr:acetyl-CoA decarbonylase/synthase complex subunit gamma [Chloroflexota bacterium]